MAARDYFYRGPIGKRIGDYMQTHDGLLATEDIAVGARVSVLPSRRTIAATKSTKRDSGRRDRPGRRVEHPRRLRSEGDGPQLRRLYSYRHGSNEAGFADRDRYYGDPDFVKIPTRELLSKDYAAVRRSIIDGKLASLAQQPGDPSNMKASWPALVSASAALRLCP